MKFSFVIDKTPLCYAIEDGNIEIIAILLLNANINVNLPQISNEKLIKFFIQNFNYILSQFLFNDVINSNFNKV